MINVDPTYEEIYFKMDMNHLCRLQHLLLLAGTLLQGLVLRPKAVQKASYNNTDLERLRKI